MNAASSKPRIALTLLGCDSTHHIGGAERFFAEFTDTYNQRKNAPFEVHFATMADAAKNIRTLGLLKAPGVIHEAPNIPSWKFKAFTDSAMLCFMLARQRFDLIHVIMPSVFHTPALALFSRFRGHTAMALNITDCTVSHEWDSSSPLDQGQVQAYRTFLKHIPFDGLFSWYKLFQDKIAKGTIQPSGNPLVKAAHYCYTNVERFTPAKIKEKIIVFASRLTAVKRPEVFVEAVRILMSDHFGDIRGWRFLLLGDGPMREAIERQIHEAGLKDVLETGYHQDMAPVFARSRAFVSCQDYENFTSLAMLEAMASGNALIARDVGQTQDFLKDKKNGVLVKGKTPMDMAQGLLSFIKTEGQHEQWGIASRRLATQIHTRDNFIADIESFWTDVLARRTSSQGIISG